MSKYHKIVFIIFLGALVLRFAYVLFFPQIPPTHDASGYDGIGMRIAKGYGFSNAPGEPTVLKPPLYTFILGILYYLFGHSHLVVRIFQSLISASFCFLVYGVAKKLMSERAALWASVLVAIYPAFISYSGLLLTEIISGFLILITIYFLIIALRKNVLRFYILNGIFLGLLILCRQEILLSIIILPLALMLVYRYKQRIVLYSLTIALAAILIISPWTMRNYIQFKTFIPVAANTGISLWHASHPAGFIEWQGAEEYEPFKSLSKKLDFGKIESLIISDKTFLKEALKNIKSHPFIYAKLCSIRIVRFWIGSHSNSCIITRPSFVDVISNKDFGVLSIKLLLLAINLCLLLLAGLGVAVWRTNWQTLFPLVFMILYVMGVHIIFFSTARYQVPIMPLVLIFSAAGGIEMVKNIKRKLDLDKE